MTETMTKPTNDIADAWAEKYGDDAAGDIETVQSHGLMAVPYDLVVDGDGPAALVVRAAQTRLAMANALESQVASVTAKLRNDAARIEDRFRLQLEAYTRSKLVGKAKSTKLITGAGGDKPTVLGFRTVKGGFRITDKDAALNWALDWAQETQLDAEKFLKLTETVAPVADKFKAHFAGTGEIPDGCEVVEDVEKFYIKEGGK